MKTTRDERITRIIFGLGVMFVGSFSFYHIIIAGYLIGLLLIGIGIYPKSTEYPEDFVKASEPVAVAVSAAAPAKRKSARRRKSVK